MAITVTILYEALRVSWTPFISSNVNYLSLSYLINASFGSDNSSSMTAPAGSTSVTLTGLPKCCVAGTVSVQSENPTTLSEPESVSFRMVNIVTDIGGMFHELLATCEVYFSVT